MPECPREDEKARERKKEKTSIAMDVDTILYVSGLLVGISGGLDA